MRRRRTWSHRHPDESCWDDDYADFTLTYSYQEDMSIEDVLVTHVVNGFMCGYPECCVMAFARGWVRFLRGEKGALRSKGIGFTSTGQPYSKCEECLNRSRVPSDTTEEC